MPLECALNCNIVCNRKSTISYYKKEIRCHGEKTAAAGGASYTFELGKRWIYMKKKMFYPLSVNFLLKYKTYFLNSHHNFKVPI